MIYVLLWDPSQAQEDETKGASNPLIVKILNYFKNNALNSTLAIFKKINSLIYNELTISGYTFVTVVVLDRVY